MLGRRGIPLAAGWYDFFPEQPYGVHDLFVWRPTTVGMWNSTRCAARGWREVYATLVNAGLNALRFEGWFPARMSMPREPEPVPFGQRRLSTASTDELPDCAIVQD